VTSGTAQYYGPNFALVGSNTRDKPYDDIYSRVTTKSNTFTVYYRVQTLKNPGNHPTTWSESNGAITGEFRGSTTIERYIDPNKPVNDYASNPNPSSLDSPSTYAWRVVENDRFAP